MMLISEETFDKNKIINFFIIIKDSQTKTN